MSIMLMRVTTFNKFSYPRAVIGMPADACVEVVSPVERPCINLVFPFDGGMICCDVETLAEASRIAVSAAFIGGVTTGVFLDAMWAAAICV